MIITRKNSQTFFSALLLVSMLVIWLIFAPLQAGGQAAYIVVIGKSMEPKFHRGDLVIVQRATNYIVGDIVAYKNAQLNSNVIHRIIDMQINRFVLKGDNNSWVDTYQPSKAEVIGKLWIHIPGGGLVLQRIRTPLNMALIAGALAGFLMVSMFNEKTKGNKRMNNQSLREWFSRLKGKAVFASALHPTTDSHQTAASNPKLSLARENSIQLTGTVTETLLFLLGVVTFAALILGIISFTRPTTISTPNDVVYQNIGLFSYSASVPAGVYDANTLQTGEPIFPNLTCSTQLNFHYALIGDSLSNITGSYQIIAQIIEPQSGWQRTITLSPETAFTGSSFDANTKLNFCDAIKLTNALEEQTDFHPTQYTLLITPDITVSGKISGHDLQNASYQPQLTFRYDRFNFSVVKADPATNPFNQTQAGFIRENLQISNTLSLFGWHPTIMTLRVVALIGLLLSGIGIWLLANSIQAVTSKNPESAIQLRYGSILIETHNTDTNSSSHIVDVQSINDLAKLAERYNTVLLHESTNDNHAYFANTAGTTYRYVIKSQTESSE
ncbi:MAG: signal peptidase I [Chloroflexota bacterium]